MAIIQMSETVNKILPLQLYPLIATQGIFVKWRAARLSEATGPRSGTLGKGPLLKVLILGDSSAAGVGVDTMDNGLAGQFARALSSDFSVDWQLVAHCGDTTQKSLNRLSRLPDQTFDVVLTALGVNDAKNGVTLNTWERRTDRLHQVLTERFGATLVIASGLPPVQDFPLLPRPLRDVLAQRCQQFDASLQKIVNTRPACVHLPGDIALTPDVMSIDGFHPTAPVYAEWASRAAAITCAKWAMSP